MQACMTTDTTNAKTSWILGLGLLVAIAAGCNGARLVDDAGEESISGEADAGGSGRGGGSGSGGTTGGDEGQGSGGAIAGADGVAGASGGAGAGGSTGATGSAGTTGTAGSTGAGAAGGSSARPTCTVYCVSEGASYCQCQTDPATCNGETYRLSCQGTQGCSCRIGSVETRSLPSAGLCTISRLNGDDGCGFPINVVMRS
jgi:collagen type VII alpha